MKPIIINKSLPGGRRALAHTALPVSSIAVAAVVVAEDLSNISTTGRSLSDGYSS